MELGLTGVLVPGMEPMGCAHGVKAFGRPQRRCDIVIKSQCFVWSCLAAQSPPPSYSSPALGDMDKGPQACLPPLLWHEALGPWALPQD